MKFYPEDGIITATDAAAISVTRTEDSLVRELIRKAMRRIRYDSEYGHRSTTMFPDISKNAPDPDYGNKALEILKSYGYQIKEDHLPEMLIYFQNMWTITW